MSNLYYAAFHAVRALLLADGLETKTHEGTQRLFAAHFAKPARFANEDLRALSNLETDRIRADYQGYYIYPMTRLTLWPRTAGSWRCWIGPWPTCTRESQTSWMSSMQPRLPPSRRLGEAS